MVSVVGEANITENEAACKFSAKFVRFFFLFLFFFIKALLFCGRTITASVVKTFSVVSSGALLVLHFGFVFL